MNDPIFLMGKPWSRTAETGPFFMFEVTIWAGCMELPWYRGALLPTIVQIWAYRTLIHRLNGGYGDHQPPEQQSVMLDKGKAGWLGNNMHAGAQQKGDGQIWGSPTNVNVRKAGFGDGLHSHTEGRQLNRRSKMLSPDLALNPVNQDLHTKNADQLQIFIRSIEGKHICIRISKRLIVQELKRRIQEHLGTPVQNQNLIYSGYSLQDSQTLQHYGITNDATITLNLRLRGGSSGTSSKNASTFRDAVRGKKIDNKTEPTSELPGPYIVEQKQESPTLQVTMPEVNSLYTDLSNTAVICRFNGFWPKADALHQWIYSIWSPNCEIYLCPKGYFIVRFDTEQERDHIINQGPWFWGSARLFITPWFSDFDAATMIVSKMPVWVRLHGLPLHFWHQKVLIAIGNSLGKFLKMDEERTIRGIFTFARICVEVDLSEGLPDHITLNHNNTQWIQQLDYENTTFRCRNCMQTGHLQFNFPLARKDPRRNKKTHKKPKGWQHTEPLEEEEIDEEPTGNQAEPAPQNEPKQTPAANTPSTHMGLVITDPHQESHMETSGIKRTHSSEGSESDKEVQMNKMENQLAIITPTADSGGWRRVEKKKGRKV